MLGTVFYLVFFMQAVDQRTFLLQEGIAFLDHAGRDAGVHVIGCRIQRIILGIFDAGGERRRAGGMNHMSAKNMTSVKNIFLVSIKSSVSQKSCFFIPIQDGGNVFPQVVTFLCILVQIGRVSRRNYRRIRGAGVAL